jgi:hypothetical protein
MGNWAYWLGGRGYMSVLVRGSYKLKWIKCQGGL